MEEATITNISRLSPDVRQYIVELVDGTFTGEPGHHTLVSNDSGDVKPYSVLSVDEDQIILMIRNYGGDGVSHYMAEREVGDTIEVKPGLHGNLTLEDADRPIALISTGTGITPMMGLLNEYVSQGGEDAAFIFGEKNTDQLLYKNMVEQYELIHGIKSEYVLSRESWHGREGYAQEHVDDIVDDCGPDTERDFYVCGVPAMVVATKQKLADLGIPDERIHSEGWEEGQVS